MNSPPAERRPLWWDRAPASDGAKDLVLKVEDSERRSLYGINASRTEIDQVAAAIISDVMFQALSAPQVWLSVDKTESRIVGAVVEILSAAGCYDSAYELAGRDDPLIWLRATPDFISTIRELGLTTDDFNAIDEPQVLSNATSHEHIETTASAIPAVADDDEADVPPPIVDMSQFGRDLDSARAITSDSRHEPPAPSAAAPAHDDPEYFKWLRKNVALDPKFDTVVEVLVAEVNANLRDRTDSRAATAIALRILLANLCEAYLSDRKQYVALSLNANDYRSGPFNPAGLGYRGLERALEFLSAPERSLIERLPGGYFRDAEGRRVAGFVTRVRATPALVDRLFVETATANARQRDVDMHSQSVVNMFVQYELPLIRVRDEEKQFIEDWNDPTGKSEGMRQRLESYNAFLKNHWVDLLLSDSEFHAAVNRSQEYKDDEDEFGEPAKAEHRRVNLILDKSLYRVFNNSSLLQGGRFYGGWWQRIPSEYRKYVTINSLPTAELDYSNMQCAMLYAMEKKELHGDAYQIDGIDKRHRKLIKREFFRLINATKRMRGPDDVEPPEGWPWQRIWDALRDKHAPIAEHFNSGIGIKLQRIDSDIAEDVMLTCMDHGVLVLPVHDSFLIDDEKRESLLQTMKDAYRKWMKQDIGVDADPSFLDEALWRPTTEFFAEFAVAERASMRGYEGYNRRRLEWSMNQDRPQHLVEAHGLRSATPRPSALAGTVSIHPAKPRQ